MKKSAILFGITILFVSAISYSQSWQQVINLSGAGVTKIAVNKLTGTTYVTTTSFNYPSGSSAAVFRKLLSSNIWENVNPVSGFAYIARTVYTDYRGYVWLSFWGDAFGTQEKLYLSTNDGTSWTEKLNIGSNNNIFSIAVDSANNYVYVGARTGVYRSTNNGTNFTLFNSGIPANYYVKDIEVSNSGIVNALCRNDLYKSTDNGQSWQTIPGVANSDTVGAICTERNLTQDASSSRLFAGANSGGNLKGYFSDAGYAAMFLSMTMTGISPFSIECSDAINELINYGNSPAVSSSFFITAYPRLAGEGSIIYSSNGGSSWSTFVSGLTSPAKPSSIAFNRFDGKLYCGYLTGNNAESTIFSLNLVVGVNQISTAVPENYTLHQNFPNPFNPITKLRFELRAFSDVRITVYNALGKEIEMLVNGKYQSGIYETEFDASGLNSGIYFYKLSATDNSGNTFTETRKMTLVK